MILMQWVAWKGAAGAQIERNAPGTQSLRLFWHSVVAAGAEFIAKDLGMKVDATVVEQLGTARKVICGQH